MPSLVLRKRYYITLMEIMIVLFLIGLIGGALAFNLAGSLDKGKAFKTEQSIEKLRTILTLSIAENPENEQKIRSNDFQGIVKRSPLVKNVDDVIKDAWGEPFRVDFNENGHLVITSEKLSEYNNE